MRQNNMKLSPFMELCHTLSICWVWSCHLETFACFSSPRFQVSCICETAKSSKKVNDYVIRLICAETNKCIVYNFEKKSLFILIWINKIE